MGRTKESYKIAAMKAKYDKVHGSLPKITIEDVLPEGAAIRADGTIYDVKSGRILAGVAQDTNKNNDVGRPHKYQQVFCEHLKNHMKSGGALNTFSGYLAHVMERGSKLSTLEMVKILPSRSTVFEWVDPDHTSYVPEFSEVYKIYGNLHRFYWTDIASKEKKISDTKWRVNMQHRFDWREKRDITSDGRAIEAPNVYLPTKHNRPVIEGEIESPKELPSA